MNYNFSRTFINSINNTAIKVKGGINNEMSILWRKCK